MIILQAGDVSSQFTILPSEQERYGHRSGMQPVRYKNSNGLARLNSFSYNPVAFFSQIPAGVVVPFFFDRLPIMNLAEEAGKQ
ncbi:MAG: hypothetical protein WCA98_14530 [Candidatus Acidiferrales bacterium]